MFGLKKLLSREAAPDLSDELKAALSAWRASAPPSTDGVHFHARYVVVDIAGSGAQPESDRLLALGAVAVRRAALRPEEALYLDFAAGGDVAATVDRELLAFLQFAAKAPLVTYHAAYVSGFLQRACRERLGLDFQAQWIDLAWLLPTLFEERFHTPQPLDRWLESCGLDVGAGRREPMENALLLARLFQMLLVRATGKGIDTAARLIDESAASRFLRRTH